MTTAIQGIPLKTITGEDASLADYAGKTVLVVNVASKCGLTPQYEGLERLHQRYRDRGFAVLGFPANDFKEQEPGTDAEIVEFCRTNFSVDFPMFSKIAVTGPDKHPLYAELIAARPHRVPNPDPAFRDKLASLGIPVETEPELMWNFEKFLIGPDGEVIERFAPDVAPDHPLVVSAVEAALPVSA